MNFRVTFLGFFVKELKQTLRDPRMRFLLFAAPLVQLIIFGVAISMEMKNISLALMAEPRDQELIEVYQKAVASGFFHEANVTGTDPIQWLENGQADAVLVSSREGRSQLLIDSRNIIKAQAIENYLNAITARVSKINPQGFHFEARALYNPSLETSVYMVPGVMCMLVCIITVILTSMAISREKEVGTLETLISAPVKGWEILIGKTFPFIILGFIQIQLILLAALLIF